MWSSSRSIASCSQTYLVQVLSRWKECEHTTQTTMITCILYFLRFLTDTSYLQGTNAHAVMSRNSVYNTAVMDGDQIPWQSKRMWYSLPAYMLLHRCITGIQGVLQLQSNLSRTHLSYLCDHQVCRQVSCCESVS